MSVRDWTALALLVITAGGVAVNVGVSIALRARDREDHERLRQDHDRLAESHSSLKSEVAMLRGRLGDRE